MSEHLLSIEIDSKAQQVFIHADPEGLELLARSLKRMAEKARQGEVDHDHFFTESWGDWELTGEPQEGIGILAKHLKVYAWPTSDGGKLYVET